MTQVIEGINVAISQCSDECPFCSEKQLFGYHTKHGNLKDEKELARSLRTSGTITSDKKVGTIYPLPGGGDRTIGWEAKAGALEEFPVKIAAAPHHIIPGNAAMAPSRLEKWTVASKGDLKEDIGYSIDCAQNGIFLPHLPEIYFTRHAPGTKTPMSKHYGQTWAGLSDASKASIGDLVMTETSLQMHYTDHDDPYVHVDDDQNYDDECKKECNDLADLMQLFANNAKCKDANGKLNPPYSLVFKINGSSADVRMRITGFPVAWTSWVSPLAQNLTASEKRKSSASRATIRGLISQLTD